ncbi:MAG: hypothetical protein K2H53_06175 [Clostridia bacterium]|nr:hypothetical protein [Clostridia bacterium]
MAYTRAYQYETSPRKLKPNYEPLKKEYPKRSTARRVSKREEAKRTKTMYQRIIMYIAIGFIGLFIISYRYSLIDDTYKTLKEEQAKLKMLEKETKQLEANIESSISSTEIEQKARELLGMQELSAEQKIYVTLPKTDHIEASSEEVKSSISDENWLIAIINKIAKNFK